MLSESELHRYNRHLMLSEIGVEGQERLKRAKIVVVGVGGLGCPALMYLAAAGVGHIGIVDYDKVDESNLQRQVLFGSSDIGSLKVDVAKKRLTEINPFTSIQTYSTQLTPANVASIFKDYDVVIDGSDNFSTRYLINDACVVLDKPFVSGSIFRFEGQLSVFNYRFPDGERGPTYRCLFPQPPAPEQSPACSTIGVLGVVPGIVGMLQANEVIKIIIGAGEVLSGKLLFFDALTGQFQAVAFCRDESVVRNTNILGEREYRMFCENSSPNKVREISVSELKSMREKQEDFSLIDVREGWERDIVSIGGELIPMKEVLSRQAEIPRNKPVVIYCRSGGRSAKMIAELQSKHGFTNLFNLKGGILAWANEIDLSLPVY